MAPVFVFAEDIAKALREGKKEVVVPENARITAAALDLIKEKDIRIIYGSSRAEKSGQDRKARGKEPVKTDTGNVIGHGTEGVKSIAPGETYSEEEVERIVNRVVERFRELKGRKPPTSVKGRKETDDDDGLVICRCEEITKGEIKEAIRNGMGTLNGIKRVTRAGMGLCQGQTCQRLVTQILAGELGVPPGEVEPTTARAPVRPLKLSVFATGLS